VFQVKLSRTAPKTILRSVLSFAISSQFVLSSFLVNGYGLPVSAAEAAPPSADAQGLENVAKFIDQANFDKAPEGRRNTFHLADQTSTITPKGKPSRDFNLSQLDLSIPSVTVTEFERDVKVTTDADGSLVLEYNSKKVKATHKIPSVKPVAFARDKEMMIVVDQSGMLLAIDIGYARIKAFTSPIPVIPLKQSNLTPEEMKSVKATFISRGVKPMDRSTNPAHIFPVDKQGGTPHEIISAGDLALYTETSGKQRLQIGQFDRDVIRTQLFTAQANLALMAFSISPPDDAGKVIDATAKMMEQSQKAEDAAVDRSGLSESEREALSSVSMDRLMARAKANQALQERDKFSRQEWHDYQALLIERAKTVDGKGQAERDLRDAAAKGELGSDWQEMAKRAQKSSADEWADPRPTWYRMLSSKSVRMMAIISAGGAAAAGIAANTAWGVQAFNYAYENYWPEVLKDSVYRVTLLKSSLALLSFVPLTYLIGMAAAAKSGFAPVKALAAQTIRVYAWISLPFWHRLSGLTRQPNLLRAMAQGFSPLKKVKADSALGQRLVLEKDIRPGISNPLKPTSERAAEETRNAKVLSAMAQQKARVNALAWLLALQAASAEAGVDPATLATLTGADGENYSKEQIEKIANDPKFKENWAKLATELEMELGKIARNEYIEDLNKIEPSEMERLFKIAQAKAKEIRERDRTGRVLAGLKQKWVQFGPRLAKGFATFGKAENDFLNNVVPNDFVVSQFWKQFVVDYWLSVVQIGVIGDRSDMKHPDHLAAKEGAFLWTTPGHRFDMVDQIRIYVLSVPASFAMTYQDPSQVRETGYDPIENISMEGRQVRESFRKGIKTWIKVAFDPTQADQYGKIAMRGLVRSIKTMQYGLVMSLVARVVAAGQGIGPALGAFVYGMIWSKWAYGFPWDPINLGNQRYENKFAERKAQLTAANAKVAQGLRLDDAELLRAGYDELARLYVDLERTSDEAKVFAEVENALKTLTTADLQALRSTAAPHLEAVTELRRAIQDGNPRRLATARAQLESLYKESGVANDAAARAQLSSVSLLEYTLKNPPFETQANGMLTWTTTIIGAFTTTYMATALAVFTMMPNVPWVQKITEAAIWSSGLYASYFYGTKGIAKVFRARAEKKATAEKAAAEKLKVMRCEGAFKSRGVILGF
jgi:hypothetical protein